MSFERILKSLASFYLSQAEAEVYVYFAIEGPQNAGTAAKSLNFNEQLISEILNSLLEKEMVNSEKDACFSALPFEKAIDLLVKLHMEETRILEQSRDEIVSQWKALIKKDLTRQPRIVNE